MIERIARAICMSAEADNWDELPRNGVVRALYVQQAEDAVRAFEPSDEQIDAAIEAAGCRYGFGVADFRIALAHIRDSILSQPQEEKVK